MNSDELLRENQALRERLSLLIQASLRINESLDFDTVLQEVVDSARALTGSRYGAITVLGDAGQLPDFIVSGLTPEEHQGLWEMPQSLCFFQYLSGLTTPLRVSDITGHLGALGMGEFTLPVPVSSLLVAPIRHLGVGVGTIYLAHDTAGWEFSQDDEETLVNTSPVGVAVFDATTGSLASLNREPWPIVDGLRWPDQTAELLLDVVLPKNSPLHQESDFCPESLPCIKSRTCPRSPLQTLGNE